MQPLLNHPSASLHSLHLLLSLYLTLNTPPHGPRIPFITASQQRLLGTPQHVLTTCSMSAAFICSIRVTSRRPQHQIWG